LERQFSTSSWPVATRICMSTCIWKKKGNSVSVAPLQRASERGGAVRCERTSFHTDPKAHGECCKIEEAMATAKRKRGLCRDEIQHVGQSLSMAALCVAGAPPSTRIRRPMGNAARWKRPWLQRNRSGVRVGTRSFCHRPRLQLDSLHLKIGTTTWPTPPACAP
jgi:hypothetical protein